MLMLNDDENDGSECSGCANHLRVFFRYAVVVGALVATIVELYTDDVLQLDDNVTIPLFSAVALRWGLERTAALGA